MKDRAAILKIMSVQTLFCEIMIKIALYLGRIWECGLKTNRFSLEMFSYIIYTYSLLGSLKNQSRIGSRIKALTFTSPALNLQGRSRILVLILTVRFDKFKLR